MNKKISRSRKIPKKSSRSVSSIRRKTQLNVESFSGPIPPPAVLADYNKAHPTAADRILKMAEQNARHRQLQEDKIISARSRQATLSQIISGAITIVSIIAGVVVAIFGNQLSAIIVISPASVIVLAYITQTIARVILDRKKSIGKQDKNTT